MKWKFLFAAFMLCAAATTPAHAQVHSSFAGADLTAIDKIASVLFQKLQQGKSADAVNGYFGMSPLMAGKSTDMQVLAGQIDSAFKFYGSISGCELVEENARGHFVVRRLYICQHDLFATRWILLMVKTSRGWVGGNLDFDDKIALPLPD